MDPTSTQYFLWHFPVLEYSKLLQNMQANLGQNKLHPFLCPIAAAPRNTQHQLYQHCLTLGFLFFIRSHENLKHTLQINISTSSLPISLCKSRFFLRPIIFFSTQRHTRNPNPKTTWERYLCSTISRILLIARTCIVILVSCCYRPHLSFIISTLEQPCNTFSYTINCSLFVQRNHIFSTSFSVFSSLSFTVLCSETVANHCNDSYQYLPRAMAPAQS